jgi:phosphohistidine swiveling domain-containing protein
MRDFIPPGAMAPGDAPGTRSPSANGGKAVGLLMLSVAGLPVPPWFSLPNHLTAEWLEESDATLIARLSPALEAWTREGFAGLALRSSALDEDSATSSKAGQYHTAFASTAEDIPAAFRSVALSGGPAPIPVIVQAMVQPDIAGVAFSANPAAAQPRTLLIEMVRGHGAALVDGSATPEKIHFDLDAYTESDSLFMQIAAVMYMAELFVWSAAADVEWCVRDEHLWILQMRPVTAMQLDPALLPDEPHSSWFFDQRFPNPISPFTRDTLLRLVADVALGDALRMRGAAVPEPLLHFHAGRAYAPQRLFETMLRGAPRWWLSQDLRQIFGAKGKAGGGPLATLHYAWCAGVTVLKNFRDVFLNLRAWDAFARELPGALAQVSATPENWEQFEQDWRRCDALSRRYLEIHRWSILWADYGYRAYQMLQALLPSATAARLDAQLKQRIHLPTTAANAAYTEWREQHTPENSKVILESFADRSTSLDYATPTWGEIVESTSSLRSPFEGGARRAGDVSPSQSLSPLRLLARLLELREVQRFTWEHILARQRRMVMHLALGLTDRDVLQGSDYVWLFTWDELHKAVTQGIAPSARELRLRRHEQFLYASIHPPALLAPDQPAPATSGTGLAGLGASPGIVEGIALHIPNPTAPQKIPPGSILILRALDPACTGIMQQAAGLIVERGGLLSHASILAREYGVPMVIGVENAMDLIAQGARVRIDGTRGTVEMLTPK